MYVSRDFGLQKNVISISQVCTCCIFAPKSTCGVEKNIPSQVDMETNTVQTATGVPPACVLSSPLACIQIGLITTTFHGKIETFESVCECLRPSCINLVLLRCAAMSSDITQPCVLTLFSFNAAAGCVLPHLYWGVSNHGLSRPFTGGFYFQ